MEAAPSAKTLGRATKDGVVEKASSLSVAVLQFSRPT
jgi:hypothetical protein